MRAVQRVWCGCTPTPPRSYSDGNRHGKHCTGTTEDRGDGDRRDRLVCRNACRRRRQPDLLGKRVLLLLPVAQHQLRDRLPTRRRNTRCGLLPDWPSATLTPVGAHGSHRGVHGLHRRNLFGQPRIGPGDAGVRSNRRHRPLQLSVRGQWGHLHGHLRSRLHNLERGNHTRRVTRSSVIPFEAHLICNPRLRTHSTANRVPAAQTVSAKPKCTKLFVSRPNTGPIAAGSRVQNTLCSTPPIGSAT